MPASPDQSLCETADAYRQAFQREPVWLASAPGRVNLIGEHIDYNNGFVLPAAIDRHVHILAAPNESDTIRLRSRSFEEERGNSRLRAFRLLRSRRLPG